MISPELTNAVIAVGKGRGFVVKAGSWPLIITAAHCLPEIPRADPEAPWFHRVYTNLLGPIDDSQRTAAAECLFVDPLADIAVLGAPDSQLLPDDWEVYESLVDDLPAFEIGDVRKRHARAWLLTLDQRWIHCRINSGYEVQAINIEDVPEIDRGTTGSPIVSDDARAVGVVCAFSANPRLTEHLPAGLLRKFQERSH